MTLKEYAWSARDTLVAAVDKANAFARDVAERVNAPGAKLSVLGVAGTSDAERADILASTPSMPLRVSDDGLELAFGPLSPAARGVTPIASAYCSVAQSIPSGTVTAAAIDTRDFADTVPSYVATTLGTNRVTVLVAGYYRVRARVGMTAAAPGRIAALIAKNGNLAVNDSQASAPCVAAQAVVVETAPILQLAAGDYVQACAFQNTGAPVSLATGVSQRAQLQVEYVGGL